MNTIHPKFRNIQWESRVRGCMLGSAIGDALGMPAKNMTRQQIVDKFGGKIDKFYHQPDGVLKAGQWTGHTLLNLATIDAIIEEGAHGSGGIAIKMGEAFGNELSRGFDRTTKMALRRINKGWHGQESGVREKVLIGSGAAARIYPTALFLNSKLDRFKDVYKMSSEITHTNPEAVNGSLAIGFVIAKLFRGEFVKKKIINDAIDFIGPSKMSEKLQMVQDILSNDYSLESGLERIGTSGSVFETVPSSLYVFLLCLDSFEDALIASVSYGGDTNTRGAIVGAMSGTYHGDEAIPSLWVQGVEGRDKILSKAYKFSLINLMTFDMYESYRKWQRDQNAEVDPSLRMLFEFLRKKD